MGKTLENFATKTVLTTVCVGVQGRKGKETPGKGLKGENEKPERKPKKSYLEKLAARYIKRHIGLRKRPKKEDFDRLKGLIFAKIGYDFSELHSPVTILLMGNLGDYTNIESQYVLSVMAKLRRNMGRFFLGKGEISAAEMEALKKMGFSIALCEKRCTDAIEKLKSEKQAQFSSLPAVG